MESECRNCSDEECVDDDCKERQQALLDSKRLKYFRQGRSLDDLIAEKLLEEDT